MLTPGMYVQDRYEIIDKIGAGGMSDVYKAKDHILGRFVAIKVLKAEFSEDRNFVVKFRTEAQSAAGLEHPNIVNIYDVGSEEGMYFIVMEYVEGITLKTYIEKKGQLSFKEADSIAIQVARGIEAAHNKNIIHRDIKPQNIIISTEGKVKVTDFGIAKAISSNTVSSDVMGSVHYTSPEHARNGYVDGRSDIYSLGIVMYEMVTGRVPFDGDTTVAVAIKHLQEEMVKPSAYAPNLPISLEKVILKCTQKNPERRYQTIGDLLNDLRKCLVSPDEDFVVIAPGQEAGTTKIITQEELKNINEASDEDENPENADLQAVDDEEELADDKELNPKMDKAMTIMLIAIAVVIVFLLIFIIGSIFGLFKFGNKNKNTETESQNTELATDTETEEAEETFSMPNVVGMDIEDAEKMVEEYGITLYIIEYREDDSVEDGTILEQMVKEGDEVKKGDVVQVVVAGDSSTEKMVTVPNVVGQTESDAETALKNAGLVPNRVYDYSDTVAAGTVISQSVSANTSVASGTKVTITISAGKKSVTVPNVVGDEEESAQNTLESAGLNVTIVEKYSDSVAEGCVISTDPAAGKTVSAGTTVTMTVSLGKKVTYYSFSFSDTAPSNATSYEYVLYGSDGSQIATGTAAVTGGTKITISKNNLTYSSGRIEITYKDADGNEISSTNTNVTFTKQK